MANTFSIDRPAEVSEEIWGDFVTLRRAKKAPITATAIRGFEREASKAGITLERAIEVACEMGWQGFRADWYARSAPAKSFAATDTQVKQIRFASFAGKEPTQWIETVTKELT